MNAAADNTYVALFMLVCAGNHDRTIDEFFARKNSGGDGACS